jgi:hypothetical protein
VTAARTTSRHVIAPIPAQGSSKRRLVATFTECIRIVESLDDGACALLEQAQVVTYLRQHVGTLGNVVGMVAQVAGTASSVVGPTLEAVESISRAFEAMRGGRRRRR